MSRDTNLLSLTEIHMHKLLEVYCDKGKSMFMLLGQVRGGAASFHEAWCSANQLLRHLCMLT